MKLYHLLMYHLFRAIRRLYQQPGNWQNRDWLKYHERMKYHRERM